MTRASRLILFATLPVALAITVATLMPSSMAQMAGGNDKVQHLLAFGALAFPTALVRPRWAVWGILAAIAYGGFIEVIQPRFGRTADWGDLGADALGALAGGIAGIAGHRLVMMIRRRRSAELA